MDNLISIVTFIPAIGALIMALFLRGDDEAAQNNAKWLATFRKAVNALPEIVEAYRLSGDTDYLLRILVHDIEGFDKTYKKLIEMVDFSDVSSSFSMEELKSTTAIPL